MPRQARWKHLLEQNQDFRRWYENLARGSRNTADLNARTLFRFSKLVELSPSEIIADAKEDRRGFEDKLFDFVSTLKQEGKTASYMSLSLIPMFAAKFFAGSLSGVLLDIWCPKEGDRSNAYLIWVFVGVMAAFAPIGILILKNVINPKIKDVENYEEDNR